MNLTIGSTANDFPALRGSKPLGEPGVMGMGVTMKKYKLLTADGTTVISEAP